MKSKILKRILYSLLSIVLAITIVMLIPRSWAAISPQSAPIGYYFVYADYLAVAVGLESLIDREPKIPESIEETKDVEYKNINGKSLQMDFYRSKGQKEKLPLLVFIHGGGWKGGKRSDYLPYLIPYAEKGYMTATVSYRLLKDGAYPACLEDITDAVQWLFQHGEEYGYDPDRIALIGGSAGAHLSMIAGYGWKSADAKSDSVVVVPEHRIKLIVDIYGPVDMTTDYSIHHPLVTSFLAQSYQENPSRYWEASPAAWLDKNDPPTLILHGTSDELVPISQSELLKSKLDSLGVPCEYYPVPGWPHTMDIIKRVNVFNQEKMDAFFKKYL